MEDFYVIFEILGKQVLVLYLAKNHYEPQIVKSAQQITQADVAVAMSEYGR